MVGWLLLSERITVTGGETLSRAYTCGLDLSGQFCGERTNAMSTAGGIRLRPSVTTARRVGRILAVTSSSTAATGSATALFLYGGSRAQRDWRRGAARGAVSRQENGNLLETLPI